MDELSWIKKIEKWKETVFKLTSYKVEFLITLWLSTLKLLPC